MDMSKTLIIFFISTFCFLSCSKDQTIESTNGSSNISTSNDQFKKEILTNLADNVILPNNQLLVDKALNLKLSSFAFTNNSNLSNLLILQNNWKIVQDQWEQNCLYNIGPVKNQYLLFFIDVWPSNLVFIDNVLIGSDSINSVYLDSKGSTVKGLPAIENFIFSLDYGNQSVLDSFNISNYQYRRKQYLNALAVNILDKASKIDSIWNLNEGNYYQEFINHTQNEISGSFNVHLNNLIELLGYIIITKLEKPMGASTGNVDPTLSESYNSENSLSNIQKNLFALEKGLIVNPQNLNEKSVSDLLDEINAQKGSDLLSAAIKQQLDSIQLSINQISSNSIATAVINEPSQLNNILNHFKSLHDLLRFDVANSTDVIVTFSGNDGD